MSVSVFRSARLAALLVVIVALSACETSVRSAVSTYRNEGFNFAAGSVLVVAEHAEQDDSLEFAFFKQKLEERLVKVGYSIHPKGAAPEGAAYLVKLSYHIDRQESDSHSSGRILYSGRIGHRNSIAGGYYGGHNDRDFEYLREVNITIDRNTPESSRSESDKFLQIRAQSAGRCEHLSVVFDEMLDAIFSNLLRANGSIEQVRVKGETQCP
ncbi:MAG: hypothetical protein COA42_09635 [Alteromonadaceae bacterium]|nr:MAG: hypothetical protein COA42_09635 [Alteromonadaceae bacterium]